MILRSGYPFWLIKEGLLYKFPKLNKNIESEIFIVGGGISGALMRYYLIEARINCVLVDSRAIGLGSTCASKALLQYEINTPLSELINLIGQSKAERSYTLCNEAILTLEKMANKIGFCEFQRKKSLYYAAYKKDVAFLKKEFEARKKTGFNIDYLDEKAMTEQFGFDAPKAIFSKHGGQTNAYVFAHALLQYQKEEKFAVCFGTVLTKVEHQKKVATIETEERFTIKTNKIIYANGYQAFQIINKNILNLKSTYAVIREQYNRAEFRKDNVVILNTAKPYLYLRTTLDGRILVGGRDEDCYNPKKRDRLIVSKAKQLVSDFNKIYFNIKFKAAFCWTATFGQTKDGLPITGAYDKIPSSYFGLGIRNSDITFSVIAAKIITDLMLGNENSDAMIFGFDR
ncbi:MAG: FAD-binding oxidoreductase [Burkholderiales bacterium]|nr:FAD-binding oxidoreductase [Flavobacterium sp.]